jgi:hypothetical protein
LADAADLKLCELQAPTGEVPVFPLDSGRYGGPRIPT